MPLDGKAPRYFRKALAPLAYTVLHMYLLYGVPGTTLPRYLVGFFTTTSFSSMVSHSSAGEYGDTHCSCC